MKSTHRNRSLLTAVLLVAVAATLVLALASCAATGMPGAPAATSAPQLTAAPPAPAVQPTAPAASSGGHDLQVTTRLIIKDGTITIVVDDPRAARRAIEALVAESASDGAFVVSADESGGAGDRALTIYMTIRVPSARFEDAMNRIAELGREVYARKETAQDVTDEYVDAQSRLGAMQTAHDRLLAIMAEAKTTKDLLEIEKQLTERESEIEALKGRMQFLSLSALLSKITITLMPYVPPTPTPTPTPTTPEPFWAGEVAQTGVSTLEYTARGVASTVIFFVIAWLPWLAIAGAVAWFGRPVIRRIRRNLPPTG